MTADGKKPVTVKKYANRRLYNTETSTYVTLEDLAGMVKRGEDFVVYDAKTGDDITRSVLGQIIFDQEGKGGQSLLPTSFLRQLIRFYGDSMQMLVPSYLEFTLDKLTNDQHNFREQIEASFGAKLLPGGAIRNQMFDQLEDQTRKNMKMFSQAPDHVQPPSRAPSRLLSRPNPSRPRSPRHRRRTISKPSSATWKRCRSGWNGCPPSRDAPPARHGALEQIATR